MELATVTSKGQITIPVAIRRKLDLQPGSKVAFFEKGEDILLKKSAHLAALEEINDILAPLAAEQGILTDEDVVALVREYRERNRKKP